MPTGGEFLQIADPVRYPYTKTEKEILKFAFKSELKRPAIGCRHDNLTGVIFYSSSSLCQKVSGCVLVWEEWRQTPKHAGIPPENCNFV